MHRWHFDDKREKVVDDGGEELVRHLTPGQMGDGLEFVVDVELGNHHDEPKRVNEADQGSQDPRIPAFVRVIVEGVGGVADDLGVCSSHENARGLGWGKKSESSF